ncbi:hypothetical protein P0R31_08815 [Bradyrhizobium yuanmingense]|nr:hypothetical protein [Bradyrhizobium yuanmingense]MDF0517331.1 hypothetical protein [Bradyrhizobium yuanmingense]
MFIGIDTRGGLDDLRILQPRQAMRENGQVYVLNAGIPATAEKILLG